MADALYTIDTESMTKEGMAALAAKEGLDADAFAKCYDAKETTAAIDADTALYKALAIPGLPTLYVEDVKIVGADVKTFERVVGGLHVGVMFAILAAAFLAAAFASLAWSRLDPEPAKT
jgi:protein-disulfide isomerase